MWKTTSSPGEALLKAIELQEQKNLKFGEMAISTGYVTKEEIERAHNAQLSRDMKLGDLLVEMGILTLTQLDDIVIRQQNTHLYIGEALVQIGALSSDQLQGTWMHSKGIRPSTYPKGSNCRVTSPTAWCGK